jgi:hypothetical protein
MASINNVNGGWRESQLAKLGGWRNMKASA